MWDNLLKIIKEMGVSKIILGYPLKESGDKSTSTIEVEKFHNLLKTKFQNEIILWGREIYISYCKRKYIEQCK